MDQEGNNNKLSEMDRLRLHLIREKVTRVQVEMTNLQMAQQQLMAQRNALEHERRALSDELKVRYSLADGDGIEEDGAITRRAEKQPAVASA